jgi:hypothetical protein
LTDGESFAIRDAVKRFVSSLLLACWLWAIALAASPALHDWAHGEEEGHGEHHCAAALLASGGCDAPDVAPLIAAAPVHVELGTVAIAGPDLASLFLIGSPLERGPPMAGV